MHTHTLKLDDLRVETFTTEAARELEARRLMAPTQDPMDCPETLPRFCQPTSLC